MFPRAKYKESSNWTEIPDPAATYKYDGAHFLVPVSEDGSLSFFSRRPSAKGGFPNRTSQLPHLTDTKHPELAGQVFNVELIHTGFNKASPESHRMVSGILNSLPERSIATQHRTGPVRAVLLDVVNPKIATYAEKIEHLGKVEKILGKPDLIFAVKPETTLAGVHALIRSTKAQGREGVIVTSLSQHEDSNPRYKIKHRVMHNLKISKIIQEVDIHGVPKESMGSVEVEDATGRVVGNVGTGFSRLQRIDAWQNKPSWLGRLIQVESMGIAANLLRSPVYNGDADGDLDSVT